jgi:mannan endo-1,4-beta-mannosidase
MPFVTDLSCFLRQMEVRLHGRAHLQTVSVFGPELRRTPALCESVFRHPLLDFATTHLYEFGSIDDPRDTVAPALTVGRLMREALRETNDLRPVLDTEHGPIHAFIDRHQTLPAPFDDEYFRHIQWAHLASGGAGGGMRWPNRHPHVLTPGMRMAQRGLAAFLPHLDWGSFQRRNLNEEVHAPRMLATFACGDTRQAVVWLLRTDTIGADGRLVAAADASTHRIQVPGLDAGEYRVLEFDTELGKVLRHNTVEHHGGVLVLRCGPISRDLLLAIVSCRASRAPPDATTSLADIPVHHFPAS